MKAHNLKAGDIIRNTGEVVLSVETKLEVRYGNPSWYSKGPKRKTYLELQKNGRTRIAIWNPDTEISTANIKV